MDYILLILLAIIITALIFVFKELCNFKTMFVDQNTEYINLLHDSVSNIKNNNFECLQQMRKINIIQNQPVIQSKMPDNFYCDDSDSDDIEHSDGSNNQNDSFIACSMSDIGSSADPIKSDNSNKSTKSTKSTRSTKSTKSNSKNSEKKLENIKIELVEGDVDGDVSVDGDVNGYDQKNSIENNKNLVENVANICLIGDCVSDKIYGANKMDEIDKVIDENKTEIKNINNEEKKDTDNFLDCVDNGDKIVIKNDFLLNNNYSIADLRKFCKQYNLPSSFKGKILNKKELCDNLKKYLKL